MLVDVIGKTMEVYVNNMLVKSLRIEDHVKHFEDVFQVLQRYRIRLNPLKCALELPQESF